MKFVLPLFFALSGLAQFPAPVAPVVAHATFRAVAVQNQIHQPTPGLTQYEVAMWSPSPSTNYPATAVADYKLYWVPFVGTPECIKVTPGLVGVLELSKYPSGIVGVSTVNRQGMESAIRWANQL